MTKKRNLKAAFLLFLLVLFQQPLLLSAQSYEVTESQLQTLEKNNQTLKTELENMQRAQEELATLSERMNEYCKKLERQKKIVKGVAIVGTIAAFCGGFFCGYKITE